MENSWDWTLSEAEPLIHFLNSDSGKVFLERLEGLRESVRESHISKMESSKEISQSEVDYIRGKLAGYKDLFSLFMQAQAVYDQELSDNAKG